MLSTSSSFVLVVVAAKVAFPDDMRAPDGADDASSATDGLVPTLPSSSELATSSRQSSPSPTLPIDTHFQLSSSQPLSLSTSSSVKATARFSDAVANLGGRNRTSSSISNARGVSHLKRNDTEEIMEGSSFGIDPDPFASDFNGSTSVAPSASQGNHTHTNRGGKKQRTSLFVAASDALGFSRGFGVTIGRRISKRTQDDQTLENAQRRGPGLPWKSKSKGKGHWALQPPSSLQVHDVIEISAANGSRTATRRDHEDNEEKERERLREAAAESIGLSPLVREDASSRLNGNDSVRFGEESFEEIGTSESLGEVLLDPFGNKSSSDNLRSNGTGTVKPSAVPNGLLAEAKQTRHHRSNSLSGALTPTTPTSFSSGLAGTGSGFPPRSSTPTSSRASTVYSSPLPPFPCVHSSLEPFMKKSSTLLKHFPSSSLLLLGLSRQWRSRCLVLTSPRTPTKPSLLNGFRSDRTPTVFHLHLFKSSSAEERELERLQINEDSVVFLADEEVGGKTSVVKVGGVDVGGRKKELNLEENGQTMWILHTSDLGEGQSWISTLKSAVLDQRAEKAGFGMSSQPSLVVGPKGDLDVLLSIRAQDVGASVSNSHDSNLPTRPQSSITVRDLMNRNFPNNISPSPTVRSWTGEGRRMSSLKGLFTVPGRTRASSQITTRSEASSRSRGESGSFASRGQALMSMIRSATPSNANANGKELNDDTRSSNNATPVMPGPILSTEAVLSIDSYPSERPIAAHRDLPAWYAIQHRRGDSSSSLNVNQSLLPPPRARVSRPRTSPGGAANGRGSFETYPGRKLTVHDSLLPDGRLSLDEPARSHSPVDSLGTNPGVFGTPDLRSRHTSLSSTISSLVSTPADRDAAREGSRRSNSIQRRMRMNKQIPKMLAPPSGPPPSIPTSHSQPSISVEATSPERPRSRASSLRSKDFHSLHNGVTQNPRRMSTSAVGVVSTTSQRRLSDLQGSRKNALGSLPTKRVSMPPPPRPAPTFALPPTPSQQLETAKPSNSSARKTSFRQSFSPRSLRFSLTPPPNKALPPRPDERIGNGRASAHRRSLSNELTRTSSVSHVLSSSPPRAPPPLGPLPPTPQEAPAVTRPTIRERLRMRSTPSTPPPDLIRLSATPTALPPNAPLAPVSSVSPLKKERERLHIGEPITTISSDLNFLNMSVHELSNPLPPDADFLNMSSPVSATAPMSIPSRGDGSPLLDAPQASPPSIGVTVLPPPPRRAKIPAPIDDNDDVNEPTTPLPSDLDVDVDVVDVHVRKHFDASISRDTLAAVH